MLLFVVAALEVLEIAFHELQGCFQGLVIDQRSDKFCLLISHFDLLWFSCGKEVVGVVS